MLVANCRNSIKVTPMLIAAAALKAQRQAAEAAIHLAKFGDVKFQQLVAGAGNLLRKGRETLRHQHVTVHLHAVGGVVIRGRDADQVVTAELREARQLVPENKVFVAEMSNTTLQMKDATQSADIDKRRCVT